MTAATTADSRGSRWLYACGIPHRNATSWVSRDIRRREVTPGGQDRDGEKLLRKGKPLLLRPVPAEPRDLADKESVRLPPSTGIVVHDWGALPGSTIIRMWRGRATRDERPAYSAAICSRRSDSRAVRAANTIAATTKPARRADPIMPKALEIPSVGRRQIFQQWDLGHLDHACRRL